MNTWTTRPGTTRLRTRLGKAPAMPPAVVLSSSGRRWRGLEAELLRISPGSTHVPGSSSHRLGIHFGPAVNADCRCDGYRHRRVQKHGDIDIVPAGLDGTWKDDAECSILRLRLTPALIERAASAIGQTAAPSVRPRFQLRDSGIEAIGWAIKAELEADVPSDPLYAESLGLALAVRLITVGAGSGRQNTPVKGTLSRAQRQALVAFVDANLDRDLSLDRLASVAGFSISHFKTLFGRSFGLPVHEYVVRRRVERARIILVTDDMPISQVATEVGFADQSHLTKQMRRVLGQTPGAIGRGKG
jgi:AraC family transcriptional regulator